MAFNLPGEHEFIRPEQYVNLGIAALDEGSVLSQLFTRINGDVFKGAPTVDEGGVLGQKVNYRLNRVASPAKDYEFRTRENPIELGKIGTVTEAITLDTHVYNGVPITNEQLTFDVTRFAEEIVDPVTTTIVERLEGKVASALESAPFKVTNANAAASGSGATEPYLLALKLRRQMNKQRAPKRGRFLLVGTNVEHWMLTDDRMSRLSETGTTAALREATLGRLAGFTVIASDMIGENDYYALTPSALLIANVAPELPRGVPYSARAVSDGWSMLLTEQYESRWQQSVSVLSTYVGINSVNDELLLDADGNIDFDDDGNPQTTGKNVRGVKGTLSGFTA